MSEEDFVSTIRDLLSKAESVLLEYPLCNSCLGRLFAKYGFGLSNYSRGSMLKTLLSMKLYIMYSRGVVERDYVERIASNGGEDLESMYRKVAGVKTNVNKCYICGGLLSSSFINSVASNACKELVEYDISTFLVGVVVDRDILERELELIAKYGTSSAESIKREVKREAGKAISGLCGLRPDFTNPDAVLIIRLGRDLNYSMEVRINPLFLGGVYWKLGRRISHVPWLEKGGRKRYPLSVQEALESPLKSILRAEGVTIHAAGREDVDARTVGSGRPLIIEVKSPKRRRVELETLNMQLADKLVNSPVRVEIISTASRRDVLLLKETSRFKRKAYRVCVYSEADILPEELVLLERTFENREVSQRTPTRILYRKRDKERLRKVYSVKTFYLSSRVFEAIVQCDGGLYVKELVHCDNGRTIPCFSGVLGKRLVPVELDVISVER